MSITDCVNQVLGQECPTLNYVDGERALLVKDHHGDWAVVIGKWVGYRKGVPGKPGKNQAHGGPKTLNSNKPKIALCQANIFA